MGEPIKDKAGKVLIPANAINPQRERAYGTYYLLADAVTFAQNKSHMSIINGAGSGVKLRVRKIFQVNNSLSAVTGVACRFDFMRATGHSSGSAVTPQKADSSAADLPAEVTVKTGATISGESGLLFPYTCQNDEVTAANTAVANYLAQLMNAVPEGEDIQPLTLNEGEGLTIKQITNTVVGSFAWLAIITAEPA